MPVNRQLIYPLIASALVIAAAQLLLPGAPTVMSLCGCYLIIGVQQLAYSRCGYATRAGQIGLLALTTLVAVGVIANVHYFTWQSGGSDSMPVLNNFDARRYWKDALYYGGYGGEPFMLQGSLLGYVYGVVFRVTEPSITLLTLLNMAMMAATLPVIASTAYQLTGRKDTATVAMLGAGCVCYFLVSGCIIIKDMSIIFGTALCARGIAQSRGVGLWCIIGGIVPLTIVRPNYLVFIIWGLIIMMACRLGSAAEYAKAAIAVCVAAAALAVMTTFDATIAAHEFVGNEVITHFSYTEPNHLAYQNIVGAPANPSVAYRLLIMPVAAVLQFLIPFPWNWTLHAEFGYSYIYAHCAYPWYLFGGIVLYYLFTSRRYRNNRLLWFTLWGLACWWAPCYFTSGTVSRYALPAVSILAPCVATVLTTRPYRRSLAVWMAVFGTGMAIALIICHHLQTAAMQ